MQLKRFSKEVASEIITWFPTQKQSLLWGGRVFGWPIEASEIIERSEHSNLEFYTLADGNDALGFIEQQKISETEMRLCRIVVSPYHRGKGLGKKLVQLSLNEIQQRRTYKTVTLGVFTENVSAYNCYKSLGFVAIDKEPKFKEFGGEKWPWVQMEIAL
ncbi:GNAT family N-acetyltransferase [Moritella sp. 36]|uniref:GNAT family N-acetyltransferase n=1 Tax=Moritella sp. 36 TaxID=2746233 RepID=UPI001BA4A37A|nr:GNAT family N-acetyltransferase [Moritella sp. 36]QUM89761.1 GNAT family N-acetyltransferase [Moritella sp. 36]